MCVNAILLGLAGGWGQLYTFTFILSGWAGSIPTSQGGDYSI